MFAGARTHLLPPDQRPRKGDPNALNKVANDMQYSATQVDAVFLTAMAMVMSMPCT